MSHNINSFFSFSNKPKINAVQSSVCNEFTKSIKHVQMLLFIVVSALIATTSFNRFTCILQVLAEELNWTLSRNNNKVSKEFTINS